MNLKKIYASLCFIIALSVYAQAMGQAKLEVIPRTATNNFIIHLQEGFYGQNTAISVDGRLVYSGTPCTDPRVGLAGTVLTTNISALHWWFSRCPLRRGRTKLT